LLAAKAQEEMMSLVNWESLVGLPVMAVQAIEVGISLFRA
jgi:hypothetical protein